MQPESMRSGRRRLRRERMLQTAVPCAVVAGIVVALMFTVGQIGTKARNSVRGRSWAPVDVEGGTVFAATNIVGRTTLMQHDQHDQHDQQNQQDEQRPPQWEPQPHLRTGRTPSTDATSLEEPEDRAEAQRRAALQPS